MLAFAAVLLALAAPQPGGTAAIDEPVATLWHARGDTRPSEVVTQALYGETVKVLAVRGSWAKVAVPDQPSPLDRRGYPGWLRLRQLKSGPLTGTRYLVLTARRGEVRVGKRTLTVSYGTTLPLIRRSGDFAYVRTPDGTGKVAGGDWRTPPRATGASVVAGAKKFLGVRYLWGGTSAWGFDCSGLVWDVFRAHGVVVPRDTGPQSHSGRPVAPHLMRPGDLVFYGSPAYHVAVFAGHGRMVESPDSTHRVRVVPLRPGFTAVRRYTR